MSICSTESWTQILKAVNEFWVPDGVPVAVRALAHEAAAARAEVSRLKEEVDRARAEAAAIALKLDRALVERDRYRAESDRMAEQRERALTLLDDERMRLVKHQKALAERGVDFLAEDD